MMQKETDDTLLGEDLGQARVVGHADVVALAVAVDGRAAPHLGTHEHPGRGRRNHFLRFAACRCRRGRGRVSALGLHLDPPERPESIHRRERFGEITQQVRRAFFLRTNEEGCGL